MAPGILYVTMSPSSSLSSSDFHNWYNNEHGPLRLRLHPLVTNGFRYRANDLDTPASPSTPQTQEAKHEWMAIYDMPDTDDLNKPAYLKLRDSPVQSQRERDLRPSIKINRRNFDFIEEFTQDNTTTFTPLESLSPENKEDNILVAACITLNPATANAKESYEEWFSSEHIPMLKKVPGWLRCRRFVTTPGSNGAKVEYLALHEYASSNGIGGDAFKAAASGPRTKEVLEKCVKSAERRTWARYYTFGPAPRDLSSVASAEKQFENTDKFARCRTFPPSDAAHTVHGLPVIESYVRLEDGTSLPYRLEGSPDPTAPLVVLSNSILTTWGIWDGFVASFFSSPQNQKYRILRYNARGRYAPSPDAKGPVTVDVLAADLIALLDSLRVKKAAAAIGVSLGGATTLAAALKYPHRIERFMACDTSASSPAGNAKAWGERIEMAEKEGAVRQKGAASLGKEEEIATGLDVLKEGEAVVGQELAEATTRRWFAPSSLQRAEPGMPDEYERVKSMVASNSLDGFKSTVQALWEYDYTPLLGEYRGKGRFLVGGEDGKLPESMPKMAERLGTGGEKGERSECVVVQGAGHLPMVEKPEGVAREVGRLLKW